jgi:hypothetical protein
MYTKIAFVPPISTYDPSMASYRSECAMTVDTSTDTQSNVGDNLVWNGHSHWQAKIIPVY